MPDRNQLHVGDKIRILRVPQANLDQRDRELRENVERPGWTADTIERIITEHPVVKIKKVELVDGIRLPWFEVELCQPIP
ncbi:MAG: hypothetical protein P8M30_06600 [Planctomycetaceae bacterium]|nr:hypothetical protein [Planctomycetaceae bacterium]MDG2388972.1 hypothetical protein [Planctomycetaceae bacterium]